MKWRQAQLEDKSMVAIRPHAARVGDLDVLTPYRVAPNKWREPTCFALNGVEIPLAEADKYHDWQAQSKADFVTALGNAARAQLPSEAPEADSGPRLRPDPLDLLWDDVKGAG